MSASVAEAAAAPTVGLAAGRGVWVVLPTYNERENLEPIAAAILAALPEASLLVVDDSSPDGTGELADTIAAREARVAVLHRPG
jgi:dolichol-phosphate mannosyltransferase